MFSPYVSKYKSILKCFFPLILLLLLGGLFSHAHSGKARYHVIIDTDTAVDDLRAICLFLASPEFEVLAFTTSDGVVDPEHGLIKVKSLLKSFGHEGIPTGAGRVIQDKIPPWRTFNRNVQWGEEKSIKIKNGNSAADTILSALESEEEPVLFVCLGGLTNLAEALKTKPQIQKKIKRIVWYNDNIDHLSGTNYEFDKNAAHTVLSIPIVVEAVRNRGTDNPVFTPELLQSVSALNSPYAEKIVTTHNNKKVMQRIKTGHLEFWDDLLPVYLLHPELFTCQTSKKADHHKLIQVQDWESVKAKYREILISRNQVESKVFEGFPDIPELFADDVRPYMKSIIQKHGKEEWRIGVLTNELHGHLGIYAIVGAKMGLRARQYFHIGIDDISIISCAGNTPPLSCMNDGLQVSTGGTVGHGLITVSPDPPFQPKAAFTFKKRTVYLRLKDQYWNIIRSDIRKGIELYGMNTKGYWKYVRKLAIKYWLEWDRLEIFDIAVNLTL
ncbi:MAG: nucleoside hydrolase [Candidatus Aminicenantes bacterium]|nr:nucleoside hydrolase [Candidatus Aminicenantes bacterium]